jgi:hypothetical protein
MKAPKIEKLRLYQASKQESFQGSSFEKVTRELLGLHSTDYWTPYLSVWSRIGNYDAAKIFDAINSGENLVRINAYRRTVHLVHVDDLPIIIKATKSVFYNSVRSVPPLRKITDDEVEAIHNKILDNLDEKPLRMSELNKRIPELQKLGRWVLLLLMAEGKVIRAEAAHARSNLTSYSITKKWVQGYKPTKLSETEALKEIIRRFIKIYGPVTEEDIVWWLMTTKTRVRKILDVLLPEVDTVELEGVIHFFKSGILDNLVVKEKNIPSVWFLPYEDVFPKAFIQRDWYLDDKLKRKVFPESVSYYWPPENPVIPPEKHKGMSQAGEIRPSIWVAGRIVGRWEIEKNKDSYSIKHDIYKEVEVNAKKIIKQKKENLEEFINNQLQPIS